MVQPCADFNFPFLWEKKNLICKNLTELKFFFPDVRLNSHSTWPKWDFFINIIYSIHKD